MTVAALPVEFLLQPRLWDLPEVALYCPCCEGTFEVDEALFSRSEHLLRCAHCGVTGALPELPSGL